ncbi:MAG: hydroxymethylglutaryl-CoA reductase [Candidatus Omnitrophica bacterium]|nr:hydroxymethylglutaryl-CoA reductase [Candidatus Omnitrophota bacterium]
MAITLTTLIIKKLDEDKKMREILRDVKIDYKIPKFGKSDYEKESVDKKREWLSQITKSELKHIGCYSEDPRNMRGNIENLIGVSQVPLGIAGPLLIKGSYANGYFFVPMATTEGALILDYHMGMKLLTLSGGTRVKLLKDSVHISPMFYVKDLLDAEEFIEWIKKNISLIKREAEATTKHGKLLSVEPFLMGRRVVLKFSFFTEDAHGLNMINKASEAACEFIKKETKRHYILRSHFSSIKCVSANTIHTGQAKSVFADVTISRRVVKKFFNVTPEDVEKYFISTLLTSAYAGRIAINAQIANGIAAIFIACGQDVADVSVSHVGVSMCETNEDGDLYVSTYIPNLFVGTVGGGTGLSTQRECLEIMGCFGPGKAKKFAEIIAGTILAGEITVLLALVSGTYVKAHERYGRNRPEKYQT